MATWGIAGDVSNSIGINNAYPVGRAYGFVPPAATSFDVRNNMSGEIGGLNQDYRGIRMTATNASMASTRGSMAQMQSGTQTGHAKWWITFAIVFIVVAWLARRFAPDGEQFAIIKPNLINGVFVTLWIVLILVFLKQVALRLKNIPLVSTLADLILSV